MAFAALLGAGRDVLPSEKGWCRPEEENSTCGGSERSSSASSPEMVTLQPTLGSRSGMESALPSDLLTELESPQEPVLSEEFDMAFRINMAVRIAALRKAAIQCYGSDVIVSQDANDANPVGFTVQISKPVPCAVKALDEALWPLLGPDVVTMRACEASANLTMYCIDEPRHNVCWHWAKTGACYQGTHCQYLHLKPYPVWIKVIAPPVVFQ